MTPLETRAVNAYFVASKKDANGLGEPIQPSIPPDTVEIDGKKYIVLSNVNGILAVYRVRIVNGQEVLKGLKRFPKEITESFGGSV